jgi:hypothetical protein
MGAMGKTTLTLKALREIGGKYLGDDMIIINRRGTVYAYPKPIRLRKFNIPPIYVESHVPPTQILGARSRIKRASEVEAVCMLERGGRAEVKLIEPEEALGKLLTINRKLLPYYMERTILAHSYMDSSLRLYELMQKETEILRDFLNRVDCYVLRCKHKDLSHIIKSLEVIANKDT